MRFTGKVAIVTGAGQGIGEAYAKALAVEGATVVIAEINEDNGGRVAAEISASGGAASGAAACASSRAASQCAVSALSARSARTNFGLKRTGWSISTGRTSFRATITHMPIFVISKRRSANSYGMRTQP